VKISGGEGEREREGTIINEGTKGRERERGSIETRGKRISATPSKRATTTRGERGYPRRLGAPETLNERRQIFFHDSTQLDSVPFAEGTREE